MSVFFQSVPVVLRCTRSPKSAIWGSGFRVEGLGFRVWGTSWAPFAAAGGPRPPAQGVGFRGLGFWGLGFRV